MINEFEMPDPTVYYKEHALPAIKGLARKYARKYAWGDSAIEECESAGDEGYAMAVHTYRPECGRPFEAYAEICIRNSIIDCMKKLSRPSIHTVELPDSGFEAAADYYSVDDMDSAIIRSVLHRWLQSLTQTQREVMEKSVGMQGTKWTQSQIAEHLGVSQAYVSSVVAAARKKLRSMLTDEGICR